MCEQLVCLYGSVSILLWSDPQGGGTARALAPRVAGRRHGGGVKEGDVTATSQPKNGRSHRGKPLLMRLYNTKHNNIIKLQLNRVVAPSG